MLLRNIYALCDPAHISMMLLNILVKTDDKKYKFINKLIMSQILFERIPGVKNSYAFFNVLQVHNCVTARCLTMECTSYL